MADCRGGCGGGGARPGGNTPGPPAVDKPAVLLARHVEVPTTVELQNVGNGMGQRFIFEQAEEFKRG